MKNLLKIIGATALIVTFIVFTSLIVKGAISVLFYNSTDFSYIIGGIGGYLIIGVCSLFYVFSDDEYI